MRLGSRQLVLPFLIGLSLTGVSATLLYLFLKKDDDGDWSNRRTTCKVTARAKVVEIKVPRQFVPVLIGRGGSNIKDIENKTDTRINFTEDNLEVPDRICKVRGSPESTRLAQLMIENIIANQPVIETYELYVPQKACGRIIGRNGETVNQIQKVSGAKIIIETFNSYSNSDVKRRIIVKGTAEQIASALPPIEEKVREENELRNQVDAPSSSRVPRGKISPRNSATNTLDNNPTRANESLMTPGLEGLMEVYVSAMDTPSQFWVQVVGSGVAALDKLVKEMTEYYNNEENKELHALKDINIGQMVAAKFSFDEQWYRAEVIEKSEDDKYRVYFVDYGDCEDLILGNMMELRTDFLSLRLQAIECSLANVKPRNGEWSDEACSKFAELTWLAQWKPLTAKVRGYKERPLAQGSSRREGSPVPCVDLYEKTENGDINVGKELVQEMLAEEDGTWSTASSTLSLSRRSNRDTASPSPLLSIHTSTPSPPSVSVDEADRLVKPRNRVAALIDLTTPKKSTNYDGGEVVDLVTPDRGASMELVDAERSNGVQENGSGDHLPNGRDPVNKILNSERESQAKRNLLPAGYEDGFDEESDELELS